MSNFRGSFTQDLASVQRRVRRPERASLCDFFYTTAGSGVTTALRVVMPSEGGGVTGLSINEIEFLVDEIGIS